MLDSVLDSVLGVANLDRSRPRRCCGFGLTAASNSFDCADIRKTLSSRSCRSVAQPGSASDLGSEGRRFESFRSDHKKRSRDKDLRANAVSPFSFSVTDRGFVTVWLPGLAWLLSHYRLVPVPHLAKLGCDFTLPGPRPVTVVIPPPARNLPKTPVDTLRFVCLLNYKSTIKSVGGIPLPFNNSNSFASGNNGARDAPFVALSYKVRAGKLSPDV